MTSKLLAWVFGAAASGNRAFFACGAGSAALYAAGISA